MLALFPEIAACAQAGDLEKLAVMVRRYFAHDEATKPNLDALSVVQQFGIPVRIDPMDYLGALAVGDARGDIRASIIISKSASSEQRTFMLCHLLGHFILHIQPSLARGEWKNSGFKEVSCPMRRYAFGDGLSGMSAHEFASEDMADRFAAALLMPAAMLHYAMEKLQDPVKVAQVFGVSKELVERRLDDLGSANPRSEFNARAGARKQPRADKTPVQPAQDKSNPSDVPAEQWMLDVHQPSHSPSRAVAAHSYSDAAQSESQSRSRQGQKSSGSGLKGMDRLRELARKMDKFGDQSK